MGDVGWQLGVAVVFAIAVTIGYRLYRRRKAAKSADRLLDEVLKGKDAFRR